MHWIIPASLCGSIAVFVTVSLIFEIKNANRISRLRERLPGQEAKTSRSNLTLIAKASRLRSATAASRSSRPTSQ